MQFAASAKQHAPDEQGELKQEIQGYAQRRLRKDVRGSADGGGQE